jgi:hypothetical protein
MRLNNPFVTTGYVSPDYFCDRENESRQMLEAIHSHRNLALISYYLPSDQVSRMIH